MTWLIVIWHNIKNNFYYFRKLLLLAFRLWEINREHWQHHECCHVFVHPLSLSRSPALKAPERTYYVHVLGTLVIFKGWSGLVLAAVFMLIFVNMSWCYNCLLFLLHVLGKVLKNMNEYEFHFSCVSFHFHFCPNIPLTTYSCRALAWSSGANNVSLTHGFICCLLFNAFCLCSVVPQGRTYPAANKGGPDPGGVALLWQHQVRHLWDRGVPTVRSGLRLGAVVSIPQPTKVLVGTTQPHGPNQVNK